jgi:hypothetical protein
MVYSTKPSTIHHNFVLLTQRAGAVFPQRPESSVPIYTPPQTQPLRNYPPPAVRNTDYRQDAPESSSAPEVSALRCVSYRTHSIMVHEFV